MISKKVISIQTLGFPRSCAGSAAQKPTKKPRRTDPAGLKLRRSNRRDQFAAGATGSSSREPGGASLFRVARSSVVAS